MQNIGGCFNAKKFCLVCLALFVFLMAPVVMAQDNEPDMEIGLSLPTIGWHSFNDEGLIQTASGINFGLGFSWKTFPGGLKPDQFNFFWGWGTVVIILPYLEAGFRYPVSMNDDGTSMLNVDIGVIYFVPYIGVSASF